ncbi:PA2169 family four-helix-bundle protein [Stutzerimonas sp. VN223-3]|uniref:PA2169 family four-helix-bundle protein n=1 Tax=Stutzerimonas TaxID=2901164 RepID=UPI0021093C81|nr:PA2169 family four-helix-bundle protein [Stutzerimonas stutzeri]MCQ4313273.1 PA2169 family four-helix-bundle protein [Stutzerimonas stutzeri]
MDTKDTISVLNDLIETSKDGEKGFLECAEDLKSPNLKTTMTQRAHDCATAAAELQQLVRTLGGDPETTTSTAGDMHRRWVDLKSMITGKSDEAILNECERGEDVALKSYRKALEKDLPVDVRSVVERQLQGVQRNHDQVKALRDAERARS